MANFPNKLKQAPGSAWPSNSGF